MVADMNVTGVAQSQATPPDSPKQKADTNSTTGSFAEALESKQQKDLASKSSSQKEVSKTDVKETNKPSTEDSEVAQENTPNPLTTKPNKAETESVLVKALKNKLPDETEDSKLASDEIQDNKESVKKDKDKKVDSDNSISTQKDAKETQAEKKDNAGKIDLLTSEQPQEDDIASQTDGNKTLSKDTTTKSAESKVGNLADQKEAQLKSLNDVKKEAQARNLNLQKLEIVENGKKNPINPDDLMDRSVLDNNKERLSLSLQDKGQALSTSLAKMGAQELNEQSKKDALLAELLNRYDANANAKRKAQNEMEKLQFKIGDGDKSMVVERTSMQPKNITESKFRNEIMEQEFLEELHNITGDDELGEIVDANRTRIVAHISQQTAKLGNAKDSLAIQKTYQGWAQQGQFLDPKEIQDSKNVAFEMEVQKPFDAMLAENLKVDSKAKEADITTKTEKKIDEQQKDKIDAKQEVGAVHTKQEVSMKNAMAREAMRNFASQFKEELLNYKPPITRINLELNPASLGQVSMTVSKRGKDLQVSITSNSNVMTMFVQNAQELRQNLMQIGFNNLDLSFSSHDGQNGNSQHNDSKEQQDGSNKLQSIEEAEAQVQLGNIPQSLEISLPEYA